MKLLRMDGPHCLLYAAAMVLDVSPHTIIQEVGHDGMEKTWPECPPPLCYRSFHIQEIIDCFVARSFGLMPIEYNPHSAPTDTVRPCGAYENYSDRFYHHIEEKEAILIGAHRKHSIGHAWAWDGLTETCYDPNGYLTKLDDYIINEAWVKVKMI